MNTTRPFFHVKLQCPVCGGTEVQTQWRTENFQYGEGDAAVQLSVLVPERHCGSCKSAYLDEQAEELRHDAVCKHLRIMTPREIVSIREGHGLTQEELSRLSRIGRASITRWEGGALYQNGSHDNYLYLLQYPENIERLRNRFQERLLAKRGARKFRALDPEREEAAHIEAMSFTLHEECNV